jgi:hypothetical protein
VPLNAAEVNRGFASSATATANLTASCHGILSTYLAPSNSPWYGTLNAELQQAQGLAREWQTQYADKTESAIRTSVVQCGQAFQAARANVMRLFDQAATDLAGAKSGLQAEFNKLKPPTQVISTTVTDYKGKLRDWGVRLQSAHARIKGTVGQIQTQASALKTQIAGINAEIGKLQSEIGNARRAISEAEAKKTGGVVATIIGCVLAPFTAGLSLIIAGVGVSSIQEAEGRVRELEGTISTHQSRIVSYQQNLSQEEAQIATLNGLTLSAGIAVTDIELAMQALDKVRTGWEVFFQELSGVITKIDKAQTAAAIIMEKVWFNAALNEWALILPPRLRAAKPIINRVLLGSPAVPVIRVVPTASHPPVPAELKVATATGPTTSDLDPESQVLTLGDYTYWATDYVDDRLSMCLLAFDAAGQLIKQLEKPGARRFWQMTLDQENQAITCHGESDRTITATLAELQVA